MWWLVWRSAVALATRMLSISDGSDMMGSLRNPAAWNNVYGLRPTWGLVPPEPSGEIFLSQLSTLGQWPDRQRIWLCFWMFKQIILTINLMFHRVRVFEFYSTTTYERYQNWLVRGLGWNTYF